MHALVRSRPLLALVAVLLIVPVQAFAGNCGRVSYAPQYAPVYQPVYAQQVLVDPYVNIVSKAFIVQTPFQSYTSVGDDARAYFQTKDAIKQGLKEAILELQQQQLSHQQQFHPGGDPGAAAPPAAIPGAAQQAPWTATMKTMLESTCIKCHNPSDPQRVNFVGKDVLAFSKELREDILFRIMADPKSDEFMPKGGKAVYAEHPEQLDAAWASVAAARAQAKAAKGKLPPVAPPAKAIDPKAPPAVPDPKAEKKPESKLKVGDTVDYNFVVLAIDGDEVILKDATDGKRKTIKVSDIEVRVLAVDKK